MAATMGIDVQKIRDAVSSMHEFNPMLGLRGCRLGITTDTYDAEGRITSQSEVTVTRAQVERELMAFTGSLEQTPPMYSALKVGGTPLYRLARRGQTVTRTARKVEIHALELLEWTPPEMQLQVRCSKGTYIRSLVHDLGQRLPCGAYLASLVRMASGAFRIEESVTLIELAEALAQGEAARLLHPLDAALQAFPAVTVDGATAKSITLGQAVQLSADPAASLIRAYAADGRLLALLQQKKQDLWQPHKVFIRYREHENHP
jgi:tRNA pseudouridine55 synthase